MFVISDTVLVVTDAVPKVRKSEPNKLSGFLYKALRISAPTFDVRSEQM